MKQCNWVYVGISALQISNQTILYYVVNDGTPVRVDVANYIYSQIESQIASTKIGLGLHGYINYMKVFKAPLGTIDFARFYISDLAKCSNIAQYASGCLNCQYQGCYACYGKGNKCKRCADTTKLQIQNDSSGDPRYCFCLEGWNYYYERSSDSCKICDSRCGRCWGPSYTQCQTCVGNYYFFDYSCVDPCPDFYFQNASNQLCQKCYKNCKKCAAYNDNSKCIQCSSSSYIQAISGNNYISCLNSCSKSDYPDSNRTCQPCHSRCQSCTGPTDGDCKACKNSYYHEVTSQCLDQCPAGYYQNDAKMICSACNDLCQTCDGGDQISNCITCKSNILVYQSRCVLQCPEGSYQITGQYTCSSCHSSCKFCTGSNSTDCTECASGYFLDNALCVSTCPTGKFKDNLTAKCENCFANCTSCFNGSVSQCTSCDSLNGYVLTGSTCVKLICQAGQYLEATSLLASCINCNSNCLQCTGPNTNQCTQCEVQKYLQNGECKSCHQVPGLHGNPYVVSNIQSEKCNEICGDGKFFGRVQCDDGNTRNGDGCSSSCTIEDGYVCSGGSLTQPVTCRDNIPPFLQKLTASKSVTSFTAQFNEVIKLKDDRVVESTDFQVKILRLSQNQSIPFDFQVNKNQLNKEFQTINFLLKVQQQLNGNGNQILMFKVKNPEDFTDLSSNQLLSAPKNATLSPFSYISPVQAVVIEYSSTVFKSSSSVGLGGGVILTIAIGSSLQSMWNLINTIQMLNYMPLVSVNIPSIMNEMYKTLGLCNGDVKQVDQVYEQNILKPINLVEQPYNERFENFDISSTRLLQNAGISLFFWIIVMFLMIFASVLYVISCGCKCCERLTNFLKAFFASFFWNGINRLVIESFLDLYLDSIINIIAGDEKSTNPYQQFSYYLSYMFLFGFTLFPFTALRILSRPTIELFDEQTKDHHSSIYQNLDIDHRHQCRLYFYPIFIFRRMIFILTIVVLQQHPIPQCVIILSTSIFFMVWCIVTKPLKDRTEQCLLIFSQACFLFVAIITTVLIIPSISFNGQGIIGWLAIGGVVVCFIGNIFVILRLKVKQLVQKCKQKCKKQKKDDVKKFKSNTSRLKKTKAKKINVTENTKIKRVGRRSLSVHKIHAVSQNVFDLSNQIDNGLSRGQLVRIPTKAFTDFQDD